MSRIASYTVGLIMALILTSTAFGLAFVHTGALHGVNIMSSVVVPIILVLAFIQLFVQLYFFLHLGLQEEARWNLIMFVITFSSILVVIIASMWIMSHLNYNMTPAEMRKYLSDQSSF
jgi:cytochrome o ubiquinol oxidase operon protein cyoD